MNFVDAGDRSTLNSPTSKKEEKDIKEKNTNDETNENQLETWSGQCDFFLSALGYASTTNCFQSNIF